METTTQTNPLYNLFIETYKEFKGIESSEVTNMFQKIGCIYPKYKDLVNQMEGVRDNAGLMAIKFLMGYGVSEIKLAGFDGYSQSVGGW